MMTFFDTKLTGAYLGSRFKRILVLVLACAPAFVAASLFPVSAGNADKANPACFADWAKAAELVQQRQWIGMAELSRLAPLKFGGSIVTARLCERDGAFHYRLIIRGKEGHIRRVELGVSDAQSFLKRGN